MYVEGRNWCGTGGCLTLVLKQFGSSYRVVTRITIARTPIRVLASKSNGWQDLGVWVQGGGIQPGYEAGLRFDGTRYPGNPSVPPALHLTGKEPGEIVIPKSKEGTLLYS